MAWANRKLIFTHEQKAKFHGYQLWKVAPN